MVPLRMDAIPVQEALGKGAYLQSPEAELPGPIRIPDPDPDSVRSIAVMMNLAKSPRLKQSAKGDRNFKKAQFKKK